MTEWEDWHILGRHRRNKRKHFFIYILVLLLIFGTGALGYLYYLNLTTDVIRISYTTDLHSHFTPDLKAYLKEEKKENPDTIIIDGGDFIGEQTKDDIEWKTGMKTLGFVDNEGRVLAKFSEPRETVNPTVKDMGDYGYDFAVLGNHEFIETDINVLNRILGDLKSRGVTPMSSNVYYKDGRRLAAPYSIKDINTRHGIARVGIVAATTNSIRRFPAYTDVDYSKLSYSDIQRIEVADNLNAGIGKLEQYSDIFYMTDLVNEVKQNVEKVRHLGADVVVVAMHSGERPENPTYAGNRVQDVAKTVPGVDVILAGHSHVLVDNDEYKGPDGRKVIVTQPLFHSKAVSEVSIQLRKKDEKWNVTGKNSSVFEFKDNDNTYPAGQINKISEKEYNRLLDKYDDGDIYITFSTFKKPMIDKEGKGYYYIEQTNKYPKNDDEKIIYKFIIKDYSDYVRIHKLVKEDEEKMEKNKFEK